MGTKAITDASFKADVIDSDTPVLVDFWAEWCGPCKMIGQSLEEISDELAGEVAIAKIHIDENTDAPGQYGVRRHHTTHPFTKGEPTATTVCPQPQSHAH